MPAWNARTGLPTVAAAHLAESAETSKMPLNNWSNDEAEPAVKDVGVDNPNQKEDPKPSSNNLANSASISEVPTGQSTGLYQP